MALRVDGSMTASPMSASDLKLKLFSVMVLFHHLL
jgi:hypothetical protein